MRVMKSSPKYFDLMYQKIEEPKTLGSMDRE
jgi:hypothetical protein